MARNASMRDRNARYYDLLERAFGPRATCKLTEATPEERQKGKCSACTFNTDEFEFDRVIADLIRKGKLRREGLCPFFVFAGLLAHTLDYGSEAQLTSQDNERFAISALERALKQIAGALNKLDRTEIEIHHSEDYFFAKLMDIVVAERFLTSALEALKVRYNAPLDKRGRPEMLEAQDIARCCSDAWKMLLQKEPGKNNAGFLDFLSATWTTVYGEHRPEPSWPHHIDSLKRQAKKGGSK